MASLQSSYFNIFTTGIVNYGHDAVLDLWNQRLRQNILNIIPSKFLIKIYHYDPCISLKKDGSYSQEQINILNNIYTILNLKDIESSDRIIESEFFKNCLPYSEEIYKIPHIIIDNANIFSYTLTGHALYDSMIDTDSFKKDNQYKINSVYLGYYGDFQIYEHKFSSTYMLDTPFFKVNDDDSVTTYTDKIIEIAQSTDLSLHSPIFVIYLEAKLRIESKYKARYELENGNLDNWLDQFDNSYFDENKVKAVIFEIVKMLFNVSSLDELIYDISSKY